MTIDYSKYARNGATPQELASLFLGGYFESSVPEFPINPFQMLKDLGIIFSFRNFPNYEGVYIPAESGDDFPIVGINSDKPITRQRFTAAHELCHHIKDADVGYMCAIGSNDEIERYAEKFAAELLMPREALLEEVQKYKTGNVVDLEGALRIADFFGVSFAACVNQLAYELHVLEGDIAPLVLRQRRCNFGPISKRALYGMNDLNLYRQLYDCAYDYLSVLPNAQTQQIFETEFIFHDSRMEGVLIDQEQAAEIIVDLRLHGSQSKFFEAPNNNIIEVVGLARAYKWVFDNSSVDREWSIYDIKEINKRLFSAAEYPEYGGSYREVNTMVLGAKFESVDYRNIAVEMLELGKRLDVFLEESKVLPASSYIEYLLDMHYVLTQIHPFRDGNGRSIRAFTNQLLLRRGLPPVLFSNEIKDQYKDALMQADQTGCLTQLYELYYREMLKSHAVFTDNVIF